MADPLVHGQLRGLSRVQGGLGGHPDWHVRMRFMSSCPADRGQEHRHAITGESQERVTRRELLICLSRRVDTIGVEQRNARLGHMLDESDLVRGYDAHADCGDERQADDPATAACEDVLGCAELMAELFRVRCFEQAICGHARRRATPMPDESRHRVWCPLDHLLLGEAHVTTRPSG
jgi:hypothetical protein